jgi:benzil reductase ((S)-benzoin forming)
MNFFYITGTSRGIGKALAEKLLQNEDNFVYGIARNNFLLHDRYEHLRLDLANLELVKAFRFFEHKRAGKIVLINNAATIGEIFPLGECNNDDLIHTYNLNLISPSLLLNNFIAYYSKSLSQKQILNISSGAGRRPISSWAAYCASKSALDMISQVADLEFKGKKDFQIWSVAPGIVDTTMQAEIRASNSENFPKHEQFVNYKTANKLSSPQHVAERLIDILENSQKYIEICTQI